MNWSHFLIAIRWQNVFMIGLMQSVVYYKYVLPYCGQGQYAFPSFLLFLVATGAVLAAGNIYNDIRDIHIDSLHPDKPRLVGNEISMSRAWRWVYLVLGIGSLAIITGLIYYDWPILLVIVFPISAIALYLYSAYLKSTVLTGNILIALLCGISVWITTLLDGGCDLKFNTDLSARIPLILYGYIINAIGVTLVREMVKDKEDAKWDGEAGIHTVGNLPHRTFKWILNISLAGCFLFNLWWFLRLRSVLMESDWYLGLFMIFIPLILITAIFNLPHRPGAYSFLSKLIKIYILFALMLLILWQMM